MHLIDSHTHLVSFLRKGTAEEAIKRAVEAGVGRMVTIGTEPDDWDENRDLAAGHPGVVDYTVGFHPTSVEAGWESGMERLEEALSWSPAPVGLGEMGLDRFHLPKDAHEGERIYARQREAFAAQLILALGTELPVVVHSRGAVEDCVDMIDASGFPWPRVVFHCFSDGPERLEPILARGGRASFTGIITYKNADNVREALKAQPIDRLMVETDAPYLAPVPKRGKPNEPAYVPHTAEFAADLLGLSYGDLADITTANVMAFYGLK